MIRCVNCKGYVYVAMKRGYEWWCYTCVGLKTWQQKPDLFPKKPKMREFVAKWDVKIEEIEHDGDSL